MRTYLEWMGDWAGQWISNCAPTHCSRPTLWHIHCLQSDISWTVTHTGRNTTPADLYTITMTTMKQSLKKILDDCLVSKVSVLFSTSTRSSSRFSWSITSVHPLPFVSAMIVLVTNCAKLHQFSLVSKASFSIRYHSVYKSLIWMYTTKTISVLRRQTERQRWYKIYVILFLQL